MKCYVHLYHEAVGFCTSCLRPICKDCSVEVNGKLVCRNCLSEGKVSSIKSISASGKSQGTAMILEIVGGLFGIFGLGWIYVGDTNRGYSWLVGMLVWDFVAAIIIMVTAGFGCFVTVPVSILALFMSATALNAYTLQHPELFG